MIEISDPESNKKLTGLLATYNLITGVATDVLLLFDCQSFSALTETFLHIGEVWLCELHLLQA